jgi:hypothetical protein
MYLWFLTDPGRLARERAAIMQLEESAGWLVGTSWSLHEGLCVDAVIRAHEYDYHVRMIYPHLFPRVPPIVRPLNAQEHWSGHQYGGADGSLCLEWRSDNWHSEVTGAQMLKSAYRLLHAENPLGTKLPGVVTAVPSSHSLSVGQQLRHRRMRFYVGSALGVYLEQLPSHASGNFKFSLRSRKHTWLTLIHEIHPADRIDVWRDNTLTECMHEREDALYHGVFFKTELDPQMVNGANGLHRLKAILSEAGCNIESFDKPASSESEEGKVEQRPFGMLILDRANTPHFFLAFDDDGTLALALVQSEAGGKAIRTPEEYAGLGAKSVGIVGLGSAGSKIAIALARMGVSEFFLTRIIHQPEKSTGEGSIVTKMSLKTTISRDHHVPKTPLSECPGAVQTRLMITTGHTSPRSPYRADSSRFVLESPASSIELTVAVRSDAHRPTGLNCALLPAPPGTTRAAKS